MLSRGRRCIDPFPSSTTSLTRIFNRSETVESRGCTVVAVFRERAEGGVKGRFLCKVRELLLVMLRALMTRVRSQFRPCLSRLLAGQKRGLSLKVAAVLVDHVAPRE